MQKLVLAIDPQQSPPSYSHPSWLFPISQKPSPLEAESLQGSNEYEREDFFRKLKGVS